MTYSFLGGMTEDVEIEVKKRARKRRDKESVNVLWIRIALIVFENLFVIQNLLQCSTVSYSFRNQANKKIVSIQTNTDFFVSFVS